MAAHGVTCIRVQFRFFTFMLKIRVFKIDPLGNMLDPCLGTMVHGYKSSCAGAYVVLHTQLCSAYIVLHTQLCRRLHCFAHSVVSGWQKSCFYFA